MGRCCPNCKQQILSWRGVPMTRRRMDIIDMIELAGQRGMSCETLAWTFWPTRSTKEAMNLVSVHVNQINDRMDSTDFRIRRRAGFYRVVCEAEMAA